MAQHPFMPNASAFEDDSINPQSTAILTLTQTSSASVSMHSGLDFDPDAMVDSFVAATSVHEYFEGNHDLTGGPPAFLSMYEGAHSLLSKATRTSVLEQMNSICRDVEHVSDDDAR